MKSFQIIAVLAGALSFSVQADDHPSAIDEVVVISSRHPTPLRQLGTAVSQMDQAEISERGYFGLADLLRTMPAIGVSNSGGLGKPTSLRIRGEEGYRTLVLIDGMDISDPTPPQVSPRVQHLPSAGIANIQVLRGPQGMMYGADAGGVLSIQTGIPEPGLQSSVRVDGGRYGTRQYAANIAGKGEQGDFYLSGSQLESDGFNARSEDLLLADDDGYENTTLHARAGWQLNESLQLQMVARDVQVDNQYDSCYTDTFALTHDCNNEFNQRSYRLSLEYSGDVLRHSVAAQRTKTDSADYSENQLSFMSEGEMERQEYLGLVKLNETLDVLFGLDHKREEMLSEGDRLVRRQLGYFAELQSQPLEPLFVTVGLRQDDNDDFGRHNSYRVSAAYLLPFENGRLLKLKGSAGNGFRAPSLYEIAYNAGPFTPLPAAAVDLQEEKSKGFDLGFEYYLSQHSQLEVVYFDQQIKDEIYFDPINYSGYLQSGGRSESTGVEIMGRHRFSDFWAISANMTFNDTENTAGEPRLQRPRQMANLTVSVHPLHNLVVHMNWRAARKMLAHDASPLDNYAVVDFSARYQPVHMLTLYGRIENAANEQYEEVLGYNTSGRAAYLGFELRF